MLTALRKRLFYISDWFYFTSGCQNFRITTLVLKVSNLSILFCIDF